MSLLSNLESDQLNIFFLFFFKKKEEKSKLGPKGHILIGNDFSFI